MSRTPRLRLPYLMPNQAQKHVTLNGSLSRLDVIVQLSVLSRSAGAEPADPEEGDCWLVPLGAAGVWAGHEQAIASWQDCGWAFIAPRMGWLAWVGDEGLLLVYDGDTWIVASAGGNGAAIFGINATADEINRLAVGAPATLFSHEGAGHQCKINKLSDTDTASLLFQTDFSGRAEIGSVGDDDFHIKVSPDGSQWIEALTVDRATGLVRLPQTPQRERLTASRTYYVRMDGDDENDGLTDDAGGALRTIGRAVDIVWGTIDVGPFDVTIQLGNGVYQEQVVLKAPHVGAGKITLAGNAADPSLTVLEGVTPTLSDTNGVVDVRGGAVLRLRDLEIRRSSGSLRCLHADMNGVIDISGGGLRLGACNTAHMSANAGGTIDARNASYTIVGDAPSHWLAQNTAKILAVNVSISLAGRTFASAFADANRLGIISARGSLSFTGAATGSRYSVALNGVIDTGTANTNLLPGDQAGSVTTGGIYG